MKTDNVRFIHCPKCDNKLLTVDVNSTETPPKYIRCEQCLEVSPQYEWVIKRYPHATKPIASFKLKKFRGNKGA